MAVSRSLNLSAEACDLRDSETFRHLKYMDAGQSGRDQSFDLGTQEAAMRKLHSVIWMGLSLAFIGLLSGRVEVAQKIGQNSTIPMQTPDLIGANSPNSSIDRNMDEGTRAEMEARRGRAINSERQKAMIKDAHMLLLATAELQAMEQEPKGPPKEDALRRIDQIEHLAHNVKERMKGSR
jgi:hypothetical protein